MDESRWLLEAITEEFEAISSYSERIPKIETDILMDNLRKLYEKLRLLQRLDDPHISTDHPHPVSTPEQPAVKKLAEPQPPPPPVIHTPAPTPVVKRTEPVSQVKRVPRPQDIDLFAQEEVTPQAVRLQDARERAFSPKIPGAKVDSLKMAIPINEKFMFINDLFDGNLREYNETIEALNGFKSLDQAAEYIDLMKRKNLWNTNSPAFIKLMELVERRF
jgi:hypothetical protein